MSTYHQLLVTAQSNELSRSAAPTVASGASREIDPQSLRQNMEDVSEIRALRRLVLRDEIARLLVSLAARLQSNSAVAR